jgi:hypothetical protein
MKNTYSRTAVRCIVFREKGTWYGVALEFNLVVDGDSPQVVFNELDQAARDYFCAAKKKKLDVAVLNQIPDAEYERMWRSLDSTLWLTVSQPLSSAQQRVVEETMSRAAGLGVSFTVYPFR